MKLCLEISKVKMCVEKKGEKRMILKIGELALHLKNNLLAGISSRYNVGLWTKVVVKWHNGQLLLILISECICASQMHVVYSMFLYVV